MQDIEKLTLWGAIFFTFIVVGVFSYELRVESEPLEMVQWTVNERCMIIHGKPCG